MLNNQQKQKLESLIKEVKKRYEQILSEINNDLGEIRH